MILSIKHRPLVSIGKLCVAVYTDEFKTQEVTIKFKRKIIIQGPRYRRNV